MRLSQISTFTTTSQHIRRTIRVIRQMVQAGRLTRIQTRTASRPIILPNFDNRMFEGNPRRYINQIRDARTFVGSQFQRGTTPQMVARAVSRLFTLTTPNFQRTLQMFIVRNTSTFNNRHIRHNSNILQRLVITTRRQRGIYGWHYSLLNRFLQWAPKLGHRTRQIHRFQTIVQTASKNRQHRTV